MTWAYISKPPTTFLSISIQVIFWVHECIDCEWNEKEENDGVLMKNVSVCLIWWEISFVWRRPEFVATWTSKLNIVRRRQREFKDWTWVFTVEIFYVGRSRKQRTQFNVNHDLEIEIFHNLFSILRVMLKQLCKNEIMTAGTGSVTWKKKKNIVTILFSSHSSSGFLQCRLKSLARREIVSLKFTLVSWNLP